jgi:type IV secretion system protein VirB2
MAPSKHSTKPIKTMRLLGLFLGMAVVAALATPATALAFQTDGGLGSTACGFLTNITGVLNAVSIVVVTIAVIFSGYQIAFAHKRISEVAPVMIGGILIGAASQIAKLFLSGSSTIGGGTACTLSGGATGAIMTHVLDHYAVVVHFIHHYA